MGVLVLDDVVGFVAQLFGHHGLSKVLVVDVGGGGGQRHLVLPESVPQRKFKLCHSFLRLSSVDFLRRILQEKP
ncbi:hypothetical protein MGWOODY_Clf2422 [hydrothermal vent metagenome]|uniref:Uncharacterized protein n=1 Tax=hydrothermal vent metagenome TaxID=652676 RepID=A0A161KFF2_9ZZZZ